MLYTRSPSSTGSSTQIGPYLQALAYDDLKVSLIEEQNVAQLTALDVRRDGTIFLATQATNTSPPAISAWVVDPLGHWRSTAEVPLNGRPVVGLHSYPDGLLIAERGLGEYLFLKSIAGSSLVPLGTFEGDCGLYADWSKADASLPAGLWLPRGPYGVWPVWSQNVPPSLAP
jgi:hypothetical protein